MAKISLIIRFGVLFIGLISYVRAQRGNEPPFYLDSESLLEISPYNIDQLVYNTSYPTLLEFYAPWCGYCKQLKPSVEKLASKIKAKNLPVQVGIVNCEDPNNAKLCSEYDVKGYPTLVTVSPKSLKKVGKNLKLSKKNYNVEVYSGEREYKPMLNYLLSKVKSKVNLVTDFHQLYNSLSAAASDSKISKPFILNIFDPAEKTKKAAALDDVLKTTQLQFAKSFDSFKVDVNTVSSISSVLCQEKADTPEAAKMCGELKDKVLQGHSFGSFLVLCDPRNEIFSPYESVEYSSYGKDLNAYEALNVKLSNWIVDNVGRANVTITDGPLSSKAELVQKSIFKNKYAKKKAKKGNKSKKNEEENYQDEL
ncbi:hypothetical protein QEN19_003081 [Hanseniaspora menglaensis]